MRDIVIDTNVLVHACNAASPWHDSSLALVMTLLGATTHLALDDTGKDAPAPHTSNMYKEYLASIPPGSISTNLIVRLATTQRIVFYPRPNRGEWSICTSLVPRNRGDAIVLGVGSMSIEKVVISNDYADFSDPVRTAARRRLSVDVLDSDEADFETLGGASPVSAGDDANPSH